MRLEFFVPHESDTAVIAHFDNIKPPGGAFVYPALVLELRCQPLDRALHAKRLAASYAAERLFLFEHARGGCTRPEIELRFEGDDFLRARGLAQPALHAGVLG